MRKSTFRPMFLLALTSLAFEAVHAQSGKGIVTGLVSDSKGGILQGARVELQPFGATAVTNTQGEFKIIDVTPGAQKVNVTYIGFSPATAEITVTAGQTSRAQLTLQVGSKNEEVLVTAERPHGEAEAINRELTSINILSVLPADVITSLPNANVADALGRLPGVTLERDEGEGKYVQIRGADPRCRAAL